MRLLILSLYYRPDLSAGSFRATATVEALRERMPAASHVDVLTTAPNRYASFNALAERETHSAGLSIYRFEVGPHTSGMVDQSLAFTAYARQVLRFVASKRYDVVFATSSRLMTGVLGAHVAGRVGGRLYLDIRDIFAESIQDVLRPPLGAIARPVSSRLEGFAVGRAAHVNLVSPGFLEYFQRRYPAQHFTCITNGIDEEFRNIGPRERRPSAYHGGPGILRVLYAGNLGEGQGLHRILPGLAACVGSRMEFVVIGDGGRRQALVEAVAAAGLSNVEILPPKGREHLKVEYENADILFLHLNDYPAFQKVLPSKIFEYAATGKPIWAGVGGFAAEFLRAEVPNAAVFGPCDAKDAARALETLALEDIPRSQFVAKYDRAALSRALASDILGLATPVPALPDE